MTDYQMTLLVAGSLKALYSVAGMACVYMGFTLFIKGIQKGGAGFNIQSGHATNWQAVIAIDKGGPGLLFALFGAGITIMTISRDITIHTSSSGSAAAPTSSTNAVMMPIGPSTVTSASIGVEKSADREKGGT